MKELTELIQKKETTDKNKEKEQTKKVCTLFWCDKKENGVDKSRNMPKIASENEEQMYNCEQCSFQLTISTALSKHMNITHRTKHEQSKDT